jgi:hypothetical protein
MDDLSILDSIGGTIVIERREPYPQSTLAWSVTIEAEPTGFGTGRTLAEAIEDAIYDLGDAR